MTMSVSSSDSDEEFQSYSERTLAIIKPEAYEDTEAIENHIKNHGFTILARREVHLTPEQAAELYRGHYGRQVAEAQAYWPDSLRACYGRRTKYGDYFNALHGSKEHAEALREIHFFFPNMIVGPLLRQMQINDYIQKHLAATLGPGLAALTRERPAEPILWLANYLHRNNPNEPEMGPPSHEIRDDYRCHTPVPSEI
ncbi:PREDICTED: nucleoside diphosphate kinase homolog 5-like [Papilio polytes]|uniref:nucleoside diphosphate kinase homolog 5-like n=1 Tax=Papilio polytes TaxID=76194 RepID=UPI00067601CC|nr:PREDICTED: nucleoside diphosphate kinase homolog 5-like [Papilio polytes]